MKEEVVDFTLSYGSSYFGTGVVPSNLSECNNSTSNDTVTNIPSGTASDTTGNYANTMGTIDNGVFWTSGTAGTSIPSMYPNHADRKIYEEISKEIIITYYQAQKLVYSGIDSLEKLEKVDVPTLEDIEGLDVKSFKLIREWQQKRYEEMFGKKVGKDWFMQREIDVE